MNKSRTKLAESFSQCKNVVLEKKLTEKEEIMFEALTARFSRLSDYLIQRIFRTVDVIELDDSGTVRDRINRAEKKAWINSADDFIKIRTMRNIIAHEYNDDEVIEVYKIVMSLIPVLLDACGNIEAYVARKELL